MKPHRTRARLLREARHVLLGWSLLCAVGATVGAVVGIATMPANDPPRGVEKAANA